MNQNKTVCIFGGTGFLGKFITQSLCRAGYRVKIATRLPESVYDLKPYGAVGQVVGYRCDYNSQESITQAINGCDAVINLVGILFEKKKNSFHRIHAQLPEQIAQACAKEKITKFIHVSAMGIDQSQSKYAASKLEGEQRVRAAMPNSVILRPSVVFGPGDGFFNLFAKLSLFLPVLPLIGGGHTKFQPVYAGDIAQAITNIITNHSDQYDGKTYALGGSEIMTFKEIYQMIFDITKRPRPLVPLPFFIAKIQGAIFSMMPKPLLTMDQVVSLQSDNIIQDGDLTFTDLGITPMTVGSIVPDYLSCYKRGGRFA